jgi:hypothetical protein
MGAKRNVDKLLAGEPGGKIPLQIPRCRWVDNIKMDLVEIEWGGVDSIGLAQERETWIALANAVMTFQVL